MKYRCPHCGQKGFSFLAKVDLVPRWGDFIPEYAQGARCVVCRERAVYYARWGGRLGHYLGTAGVALLTVGAFFWFAKSVLLKMDPGPGTMLLLLCLLFVPIPLVVFKWLFCHLDKPSMTDYIPGDKFRFTAPATVRLWPRVRVGEIYLIRFPKRKKREDGPYLIGMVTNVEKDGETQEVTVRVVKEYLMGAPLPQEELVLTTEGNFSVEGVVSQTYRLPPQEE